MKQLQTYIRHVTAVYTATAMLLLLLNLALEGNASGTVVNTGLFLMIFVFALVFALADVLYLWQKPSFGLRVTLHFVLVVGGAYLCLYLPSDATDSGAAMQLLMFVLLIILYWIFMGIFLGVTAGSRRKKAQEAVPTYKSLYKK